MLKDEKHKQFWWLPDVQMAIRSHKLPAVMRLLDDVIFNREKFDQQGLALYTEEDRQYALLCKVNLLQSASRPHEALAWLCLENTLHPDNTSARAMMEELLNKLPTHYALTGRISPKEQFSLGWKDVAGMEEVKLRFERDIILPLKRPEIYKEYKLSPPNGVLLWGPPGCGKTFLASKLAERLEYEFIELRPSDIASIYVHGTVQLIAEVFDKAEQSAPAIIFIDELDAIAPSRTDLYHSYSEEVNQLLIRLNDCSSRGITVIGATNRPDRIDSAIKRPGRFDLMVYVPQPDLAAREQLFRMYLQDRKLGSDIDVTDLAIRSGGYTCVDIKHLCDEAARYAMSAKEPICQGHLLQSLATNHPSVSSEEILEYERLRAKER